MTWRFLHPLMLLLLIIPIVILVREILRKKRHGKITYSDLSPFKGAPISWRLRLMPFIPWLRFLALSLMILALARPQYGRVESVQSAMGIDISMILDISETMDEGDYYPTRLDVAKEVMENFVMDRENDRINLVIFGTSPYLLVPPTFDKPSISNFIGMIQGRQFSRENRMTAIGSGLALGVSQLKDSESESRVAILLTDGENNAGQITPIQAAEIAKVLGVRVYTIGLIGRQRASMWGGNRDYNVNREELQQIADLTGGKFYMATDEEALSGIYKEIDELEKIEIETAQHDNFGERFWIFLTPALMILGLDLLLRFVLLRRLP